MKATDIWVCTMTDTDVSASEAGIKSKVLVCDDSKLVRLAAKKILSARFELVLAEDGEEGWDKITTDDAIQVVFTDLGMPKLDGSGLIQRVRKSEDERIRNLPMIVITGATDDEDLKQQVYEIGATDFVTKPFKATAIIARADAHTNYRLLSNTLKKSVNIDPLTGVLNRKGFDERLEKDMSFINRHAENLAIMMFELDQYDDIHDRIGQKTSESVIKAVAKTLSNAIRKEDSICRDEMTRFIVSLPLAKTEGVIKLSKRLCERTASFKIKVGDTEIVLSSSVGVSTVTKGCHATAVNIVRCAEQALENAKSLGRGEVQYLKLEAEDSAEPAKLKSIDALLECIARGQHDIVIDNMSDILGHLAPLVALMSDDQKQMLIRAK